MPILTCGNSLQYTRQEYRFYRIVKVADGHVIGKRQVTADYKVQGVNLPWHEVGVFKVTGESAERVKLPASYIHGKALLADKVIVSISRNMLQDK